VVVGFLCDLHIVRAIVELSKDLSVVEVIVVGAGGRQWN
jgi:hypothetical protein